MKNLRRSIILVVLGVFAITAILVATGSIFPARAALGNNGVPVRCDLGNLGISPGEELYFNCYASDGTLFTDKEQRVPKGYYLLVTDIIISPQLISSTPGYFRFLLQEVTGTDIWLHGIWFLDITGNTVSEHFSVPYFVLPAKHKLRGGLVSRSDYSLDVHISGLLVTNLSYLPFTMK